MNEENKVPYIVFESEMARYERAVRRLVTIIIIAITLLFASNVGWLMFFNQFDFSTETVSQGTESGDNSYIGASGVINADSSDD